MTAKGWILIAGTLLMLIIMAITGRPMKHPATPLGIINLELAANATDVQNIINAWDNDISQRINVMEEARLNTWLDFIFLFFYSSLFYFLCRWLAASFKPGAAMQKAANIISIAAVLAGLLDAGENMGMLINLYGTVSNTAALITAACATVKWVLVFIIIFFLQTAFFYKKYYLKDKKSVS